MELFNTYKSGALEFIINYVLDCYDDKALTESEFIELITTSGISNELKKALLNEYPANTPNAEYNLNIFTVEHNKVLPSKINGFSQMPAIRLTKVEKNWLYYILHDPKITLFLEDESIQLLLNELESDSSLPFDDKYIDIRDYSNNKLNITVEYKANFKKIIKAIREKKYLKLTNRAFNGEVYANQLVIPYKIVYNEKSDYFSLSCWPLKSKRAVKMNLANLSDISVGDVVDEDTYIQHKSMIEDRVVDTPIRLEITDTNGCYDRCSCLFAAYKREAYTITDNNGNEKIIMDLYYYTFQEEHVISKILSLHPFVKVLSPQNIIDKIISLL